MADFPTALTSATDNVTDVVAAHLNNLEAKVGIDSSAVTKSLDYLLKAQPEGHLTNGKIVPSVTSNNLTVALKGMDGNNPSATNPVYVRIGSVVRSITSDLTITGVNAGTNWMNMGSAELATKEVDLFVYLIAETNTNTVGMVVSRVPYATVLGDMTWSNTVEKGILNSPAVTNVATDVVVNIGRFAATLSAGAGYTWSVPTFTATNLIQRPIYETRNLDWTATRTYAGGTADPLSATPSHYYKVIGNQCYVNEWMYSADPGTGARTSVNLTLPFSANAYRHTCAGFNINSATYAWSGVRIITTTMYIQAISMTDNVGWEFYFTGSYGI